MVNIDTVVGATVGFIVGLLSWLFQQQVERRQQKHNVLKLLHLENEQNLKILEKFWQQVWDLPSKDFRDIERYHRLAYNDLPSWEHLMWESQASLLSFLDEKLVTQNYELNHNLDAFLILRQKIRDAFEKNKELWEKFVAWNGACHNENDYNQQAEAQNGKEGRIIDMETNSFSSSLIHLWNVTNNLYNDIHDLGNPISYNAVGRKKEKKPSKANQILGNNTAL